MEHWSIAPLITMTPLSQSESSSTIPVAASMPSSSQSDGGGGGSSGGTSSHPSSVSLLDKYANLHSDMDQARKESVQHQSEIIQYQNQIQDLLELRQKMTQETRQALKEQEGLQGRVDETSRELQALEEDFSRAESRRAHAHTVLAMTQRRREEYRQDFFQSTRCFRSACQDVLRAAPARTWAAAVAAAHGKNENANGKDTPITMPLTESREMDIDPSSSDSCATARSERRQQAASSSRLSTAGAASSGDDESSSSPSEDDNDEDQSPATQANTQTSHSCSNILKTDWASLVARVLPKKAQNEVIDRDRDRDAISSALEQDSCTATDSSSRRHSSTALGTSEGQEKALEPTETETSSSLSAEDAMEGRPSSGDEENPQNENVPPKVAPASEIDRGTLFAQLLREIETVEAAKDSELQEAKERLVLAESQHDQALQARDEIQEEHRKWATKVNGRRTSVKNLHSQNQRVGSKVKSLQEKHHLRRVQAQEAWQNQMSVRTTAQSHSSTDPDDVRRHHGREKQRLPSRQGWYSADRATGDHAHRTTPAKRTTSGSENGDPPDPRGKEVRNPYLQKSSKKRAPPLPADSDLSASTPRRQRTVASTTSNEGNMSNSSRGQERGNAGRRAIVSPPRDLHATGGAVDVFQSRDSQSQHPHRSGRVRGARGFGISMSLDEKSNSVSPLQRPFDRRRTFPVASTKPRPITNQNEERDFHYSDSANSGLSQSERGSPPQPSQTPREKSARSSRTNVVSTTKRHVPAAGTRNNSRSPLPCPTSTPFGDEYEYATSDDDDDDDDEVPGFAFRKK